jgi:hypothetical protein
MHKLDLSSFPRNEDEVEPVGGNAHPEFACVVKMTQGCLVERLHVPFPLSGVRERMPSQVLCFEEALKF